ncbi:glycosyl hydrolase [Enterococcus sp.]|uniref:glycosyl hydrolase n=1 Tax=Enterococcus sp. TaxID=35783 RepID=UPI0029078FE3|nr:glycosyl hydrolase [Enterococcus sp.]MDU5336578.1 glycosyl hydrolase [Enterococcus sp.]
MKTLKEKFMTPSNESRPRLRYWWPGGYVAHHLEELDQEMKDIAEAGFGGVEISDVYDAIAEEDAQVLTPEKYGFTSDNWRISVKQAMKSAKKYGLKVDLTVGPHWPASTNEADPNDLGTAKELVYGTYSFSDSISEGISIETLCPPHYLTTDKKINGEKINNKLIAVYLAEHVAHKEVEMPPAVPWEETYRVISDDIPFDSLVEITGKISEGRLVESVVSPHSESILIAIYERGTGQRVNMFSMGSANRPDVMAPYAYVVDHFSPDGASLVQSLWEKNFLFDSEFQELLSEVGDCFFEDSLELQSVGHWTHNMLQEFKTRKGYDIRPFLPFVLGINQDKGLGIERSCFQPEKEKEESVGELRHDYFEVLNQLYQEYHLAPLKKWANSLGLNYRAQPYGWAIDSASASTKLDVVEGESLGFGEDGNDAFRMLAAGRDFGASKILSDEAGAYLFQGYATSLEQLFETLHKNYMAGVNQTYWHGFPFKFAPGARWPGFSAFNPMLGGRGFAEPWGPRQPIWNHLYSYTTYLGRLHEILRWGKNELDVLVYQSGHNASENKQVKVGNPLTQRGYRYQVMTEGLFSEPVKIENHLLVTKGAEYRSLLIPEDEYLTKDVRRTLKDWQDRGLKVVFQKSENLRELVDVLGESEVANESGNLLTYQRANDQHRFVVCYNQGEEPLSLSKLFQTYNLREWYLWKGEVDTVNEYQLLAKECRVFEILKTGETEIPDVPIPQTLSLKKSAWSFSLESWEMDAAETLEINKVTKQQQLTELNYWNELSDFENLSGIGTYRLTLSLEGKKPRKIRIVNAKGSLIVRMNGYPLSGNPFTGEYYVDKQALAETIKLEIVVGSTLNNYLNDSPLADYYGQYQSQNYGIEDVEVDY